MRKDWHSVAPTSSVSVSMRSAIFAVHKPTYRVVGAAIKVVRCAVLEKWSTPREEIWQISSSYFFPRRLEKSWLYASIEKEGGRTRHERRGILAGRARL